MLGVMATSKPIDSNESTTPGRPNDASSRQQTHQNQTTQSGSQSLDKQKSGKPAVGETPPGPK